MKIEKITENQIRVIIKDDDLPKDSIDFNSLMVKSESSQKLFLKILEKAEKEFNFYTDGHKLLIEAFTSIDGFVVFTITKFIPQSSNNLLSKNTKKRRSIVKKNIFDIYTNIAIYAFFNFDDFFNFCCFIRNISSFESKKLAKHFSLILYNSTYFLVIKNIDANYSFVNSFHSIASEFGKYLDYSKVFEGKLLEYGKIVKKNNALNIVNIKKLK